MQPDSDQAQLDYHGLHNGVSPGNGIAAGQGQGLPFALAHAHADAMRHQHAFPHEAPNSASPLRPSPAAYVNGSPSAWGGGGTERIGPVLYSAKDLHSSPIHASHANWNAPHEYGNNSDEHAGAAEPGSGRSGPFMRALAGILPGPSDMQRALAEEGRERLKRDLEEQVCIRHYAQCFYFIWYVGQFSRKIIYFKY